MSVRFVLRVCQVCVHLAHVELTAAIQLIILALVLESAASFFTSLTSPDTLDLMNVRTSSWSFVIGFCVVLRPSGPTHTLSRDKFEVTCVHAMTKHGPRNMSVSFRNTNRRAGGTHTFTIPLPVR